MKKKIAVTYLLTDATGRSYRNVIIIHDVLSILFSGHWLWNVQFSPTVIISDLYLIARFLSQVKVLEAA